MGRQCTASDLCSEMPGQEDDVMNAAHGRQHMDKVCEK